MLTDWISGVRILNRLLQGKVGGIGLANIQRRLGLLYPEHYKLEQREDENLYSVILSITL